MPVEARTAQRQALDFIPMYVASPSEIAVLTTAAKKGPRRGCIGLEVRDSLFVGNRSLPDSDFQMSCSLEASACQHRT
jgi:hypothetical protein